MNETEHFFNDGYGWTCVRCSGADAALDAAGPGADALPRFFREGESEEREARFSTRALARWKDDSRRTLVCPRCGIEENTKEKP